MDFADRESIIDYLTQKYGEDRVCQIINFSYITPVVAIKDVGRVLNIPYAVCDKISKKFTYPTFKECIENNQEIYERYSEYHVLFEIASRISGRVRNVSIHAGGVGIVDTKITDYMGMKLGGNNEHVIQVDKKKIEEIGIIKFDILGVATLGIVQYVKNQAGLTSYDISVANPNFLHDEAMYKILQEAKTNGVFQVESSGMRDLLLRLKPSNLEDVSAVLALYRPDSMSMLEDYIYYKHHPDEVTYWHPDMEPILNKTYGCIIYQEEIMDIVRVFGGRSYGGSDLFRKAIGKKDPELVKSESQKLYSEIIEHGYEEPLSKRISDHLAAMGGYSFNKCLSGNTKLMLSNGTSKTIKELFKSKTYHTNVISMNNKQSILENRIVNILYSGYRMTYKITTDTGRFIFATNNHKFPIVNETQKYKMVSELLPSDKLYTVNSDRKIVLECIRNITPYCKEDVYDIEMADPYHNFVVESGIVTCNSHSALYSILTLKTAYLKAHYPALFFCALLNQNKGDYGKINKYILDANDFHIQVTQPDINKSQGDFSVADNQILFGFESISGIGKQLSDQIIQERNLHGKYRSFKNFIDRINPSVKQIVMLAKAGAFPCNDTENFLIKYAKSLFDVKRYTPVSSLPTLKRLKEDYGIDTDIIKSKEERLLLYNQKKKVEFNMTQQNKFEKHMNDFAEKYLQDKKFWEFEALSVFIKNNPFNEAYQYITKTFDQTVSGEESVIVGVISNVQKKKDRHKNQYAYLNIYSTFGLIELTCWASQYKKYQDIIKRGNQIAALIKNEDGKAYISDMKSYQDWLNLYKKKGKLK